MSEEKLIKVEPHMLKPHWYPSKNRRPVLECLKELGIECAFSKPQGHTHLVWLTPENFAILQALMKRRAHENRSKGLTGRTLKKQPETMQPLRIERTQLDRIEALLEQILEHITSPS